MASFSERLSAFVKKEELIQRGDRVCAGVSGGADSVCLLLMLSELSRGMGFELYAFHVNHCLRGAESDGDELFTKRLCDRLGVPVMTYRYNVKVLADEKKIGTEEAGRLVRRKLAADSAKAFGANKIALAHHMNDCAETLLFNLARGTSVPGMKGIAPKSGNIIRPLAAFGRDEIEAELLRRGEEWRTDSTNSENEYARNRLRNEIIPRLEKDINAASVRHIASAAADMNEAGEIIAEIAGKRAENLVLKTKGGYLVKAALSKERRLIAGCVVMDVIKRLTPSVTDIKRAHIYAVLSLFDNQSGRSLDLPYGIRAERVYDGVRLVKPGLLKNTEAAAGSDEGMCESAVLNTDGDTPFAGYLFSARLIEAPLSVAEIPKKKYTKWLDYDKLSGGAELRHALPGDYITIDSAGHTKKLSRHFKDIKLPKENRAEAVVLAAGSHVIWIVGGRISESFKLTGATTRVLEVSASEAGPLKKLHPEET